jgi:hypothetical protein
VFGPQLLNAGSQIFPENDAQPISPYCRWHSAQLDYNQVALTYKAIYSRTNYFKRDYVELLKQADYSNILDTTEHLSL